VQFDDYFYAETPGSALNDTRLPAVRPGICLKADWRRHNTQQLIVQVSRAIKQLNLMLSLASARRACGVTAL
jgi:uncharacterized lipoprotein YddW (UPF0748 family)